MKIAVGITVLVGAGLGLATIWIKGLDDNGASLGVAFARGPGATVTRAAVSAVLVSIAIGWLWRPIARRLGLVVHPRLWHARPRPTPILGGIPIAVGLVVGVLYGAGTPIRVGRIFYAAAAGVVVLAALGLIDDLRHLAPHTRLLWGALVASLAYTVGLRAQVFPDGTVGIVGNAVVTVLWLVIVPHALNIFDNLDGATGGVVTVSGSGLAAIAVLTGGSVQAGIGAAIAGAAFGYLLHNRHPARLFMGDSGTLPLGYAIGTLSIMLRPGLGPPLAFAVPLLAIGVPLFDTVLVTTTRLRARRPVSVGDGSDHLSFRLLYRGWSVHAVNAFLWVFQAVLVAAATLIVARPQWGWAIVGVVAGAGLVLFVVVIRLPEWQPPRPLPRERGRLEDDEPRRERSEHRGLRT